MKIFLGADHTGFELKGLIKNYLAELGYEVKDCGNDHYDPDDNFPDFILPVARAVASDSQARGIIIGGSGQGEALAANKIPQARAVVYYGSVLPTKSVDITGRQSQDPYEIIKLSRLHNDSNILSLGVRFITDDQAKAAVKAWLETDFSGLDRYAHRIKQVEAAAGLNGHDHERPAGESNG